MTSPAIILVRSQLGMNIGMAARAMANFALQDMRLVSPRDGWPNPEAGPAASGADPVLEAVTVYDSVDSAMADCQLTFATTVRPRDMAIPVITPREAARRMREAAAQGRRSGIIFGPERSGLTADDLANVQAIITCPVNPEFGSLNLAQAVLLIAYEWYQAEERPAVILPDHVAAPHEELAGLIGHLETSLEESGFFHVPDRTPATKRALAQMLTRADFSSQDIRTLRGVIRSLAEERRRKRARSA